MCLRRIWEKQNNCFRTSNSAKSHFGAKIIHLAKSQKTATNWQNRVHPARTQIVSKSRKSIYWKTKSQRHSIQTQKKTTGKSDCCKFLISAKRATRPSRNAKASWILKWTRSSSRPSAQIRRRRSNRPPKNWMIRHRVNCPKMRISRNSGPNSRMMPNWLQKTPRFSRPNWNHLSFWMFPELGTSPGRILFRTLTVFLRSK